MSMMKQRVLQAACILQVMQQQKYMLHSQAAARDMSKPAVDAEVVKAVWRKLLPVWKRLLPGKRRQNPLFGLQDPFYNSSVEEAAPRSFARRGQTVAFCDKYKEKELPAKSPRQHWFSGLSLAYKNGFE
eukprot:1161633-Pelagomonas_calceolata.AAC.6